MLFGEFLSETWRKAATPENAIAGFRSTGIHPFNVDAILDFAFVVKPRPSENENCEPAPDSLLETNLEKRDSTKKSSGILKQDTKQYSLSSVGSMEIQIDTFPAITEEPSTSFQCAEINLFSTTVDRQLMTSNVTSPSTSAAYAISLPKS
ncbi:hypothetical protein PR048_020331 [Dryococelus australis]|uniref:Uncharacterized protein n=1 Tax=Dryococelus australis TaxID=614101 RepID=A0ABQ9H5Z8_9NEOP|nr:hypothetical protein PR048_020331 [Dryococelus australis]